MTKRKHRSVHGSPWTPFLEIDTPSSDPFFGDGHVPAKQYANSRYHVAVWFAGGDAHPMGKFVHLSIKDHDRSARHDWRDLQRIKNEIVGPEFDAVELYPAESRLVDTCNQYHLFVFATWRAPFGFDSRLVSDGRSAFAPKAEQRPFEQRPADCLTGDQLNAIAVDLRDAAKSGGAK